jgi:hypothetical protein
VFVLRSWALTHTLLYMCAHPLFIHTQTHTHTLISSHTYTHSHSQTHTRALTHSCTHTIISPPPCPDEENAMHGDERDVDVVPDVHAFSDQTNWTRR